MVFNHLEKLHVVRAATERTIKSLSIYRPENIPLLWALTYRKILIQVTEQYNILLTVTYTKLYLV